MDNRNFITIQSWMVNDLKLSGNELICYALIYGFSQDGESEFKGSHSYVASCLNVTRDNARKIILRLVANGLIEKRDEEISGVRFCRYKAIVPKEEEQDTLKQCNPCTKTVHDKYKDNIDSKEERDKSLSKKDDYLPFAAEPLQDYDDKTKKKRKTTPKDDKLFEECWKAYNRKGSKAKSKSYWDKLTEGERAKVMTHIKAYVETRERRYQSDFERYLRDKKFNDVVYDGNSVLYDPETYDDKSTYHPYVEYPYLWLNENDGKYYFTGHIMNLGDGYTKDNRPNGAEVHQNGYTYTWDAEKKEWDMK